jgi:ArsR family transcriptional regulator
MLPGGDLVTTPCEIPLRGFGGSGPVHNGEQPECPSKQEGMMRAPPGAGENQAVRWFRALADVTRLRIIDRLRVGEESVGNLADALATGQSRLSFHLKTLRDAGLVRGRRQGRLTYYSLDLTALRAIARVVESMQPRGEDPGDRKGASGPAAARP